MKFQENRRQLQPSLVLREWWTCRNTSAGAWEEKVQRLQHRDQRGERDGFWALLSQPSVGSATLGCVVGHHEVNVKGLSGGWVSLAQEHAQLTWRDKSCDLVWYDLMAEGKGSRWGKTWEGHYGQPGVAGFWKLLIKFMPPTSLETSLACTAVNQCRAKSIAR